MQSREICDERHIPSNSVALLWALPTSTPSQRSRRGRTGYSIILVPVVDSHPHTSSRQKLLLQDLLPVWRSERVLSSLTVCDCVLFHFSHHIHFSKLVTAWGLCFGDWITVTDVPEEEKEWKRNKEGKVMESEWGSGEEENSRMRDRELKLFWAAAGKRERAAFLGMSDMYETRIQRVSKREALTETVDEQRRH